MELASRKCYHWFSIIASGANTLSVEPPEPLHDPNVIHQPGGHRAELLDHPQWLGGGPAWQAYSFGLVEKKGFLEGFCGEVFFQLRPPCRLVATNLGCELTGAKQLC